MVNLIYAVPAFILLNSDHIDMEEDRAQTDLGIAADMEESQSSPPVQKQPKKRFIGRRAAANAVRNNGANNLPLEESGAVQGWWQSP